MSTINSYAFFLSELISSLKTVTTVLDLKYSENGSLFPPVHQKNSVKLSLLHALLFARKGLNFHILCLEFGLGTKSEEVAEK